MRGESANLDFLRAVAVSWVLVFHLLLFFGHTELFGFSLRPLGLLGVLMFFVHTSLVLMLSLERQVEKWGERRRFLLFMVRRCFRIYPLSVLIVLAIAGFRLPLGHLTPGKLSAIPQGLGGLAANLLLVQNLTSHPSILGPLWSLPLEMQMYVFLPGLFLFVRRTSSPRPLVALWAASVALALAQPRLHHVPDLVLYVPCFLPGIIAFKTWGQPRRWPFYAWPLTLLAVTALSIVTIPVAHGWVLCLALGWVIPQCMEMRMAWLRAASHTIAKYSYGIYLTHYFAVWLAFMLFSHLWLAARWALFAIALVGVPVVLYHGLEAPMTRWGGTVAARFRAQPLHAQVAAR